MRRACTGGSSTRSVCRQCWRTRFRWSECLFYTLLFWDCPARVESWAGSLGVQILTKFLWFAALGGPGFPFGVSVSCLSDSQVLSEPGQIQYPSLKRPASSLLLATFLRIGSSLRWDLLVTANSFMMSIKMIRCRDVSDVHSFPMGSFAKKTCWCLLLPATTSKSLLDWRKIHNRGTSKLFHAKLSFRHIVGYLSTR